MPFTDADVIRALSDPVLQRMNFWVVSIHVLGESYNKIKDFIETDQILVVGGNENRAQYDAVSDTITTQKGDPPANLFERSRFIHECTHAIVDMDRTRVTWLINETAARIAQATFLLLQNEKPTIPAGHHMEDAMNMARQFALDKEPGRGTRLSQDDIMRLTGLIYKEPSYHRQPINISDGISTKARKKVPPPSLPAEEPRMKGNGWHPQTAYKVPSDALFDFNKYNIKPTAEAALQQAAAYIAEFKGPGSRVFITGYTDKKGDRHYNELLSKRRADAVAQWLITHQIVRAADVITYGAGASKFVAPNERPDGSDDPDGRARNRRVEIMIM